MKKLLFVSAIFTLAFSTKTIAQDDNEFKPFKLDISMGYAMPMGGSGSKGGFLFAIEPKYAVLPQLSLGIRMEAAVTVTGIESDGDYNSTATAKASASYLATGDFYFSSNDFRPFVGAGTGLFKTASAQIESEEVASGTKFGGMVRAGFEYKHGRFGLEYNMVGKTSKAATPTVQAFDVKNSYIGIKFGVCIGGGKL